MTFHEKSAWAAIVAILLVFIPYFTAVFNEPLAFGGLLIEAVIGTIVLLVGFHIVNALATRSIRTSGDTPKPDELDKLIELKAAKLSGTVLSFVVLIWFFSALFGSPAVGVSEFADENFVVPIPKVLTWIQLLFAGFVISDLIYYGRIVTSYRLLAHG